MSRTYARCKVCHKHRTEVHLSARGLCPQCAMDRQVLNAGLNLGASTVARLQAEREKRA